MIELPFEQDFIVPQVTQQEQDLSILDTWDLRITPMSPISFLQNVSSQHVDNLDTSEDEAHGSASSTLDASNEPKEFSQELVTPQQPFNSHVFSATEPFPFHAHEMLNVENNNLLIEWQHSAVTVNDSSFAIHLPYCNNPTPMIEHDITFLNTTGACSIKTRSVRNTSEWQPLDNEDVWYCKPYKFIWKVVILKNHIPHNYYSALVATVKSPKLACKDYASRPQQTCNLLIELFRTCDMLNLTEEGLALQLLNKRIDEHENIEFEYVANFETCSYAQLKSMFLVRASLRLDEETRDTHEPKNTNTKLVLFISKRKRIISRRRHSKQVDAYETTDKVDAKGVKEESVNYKRAKKPKQKQYIARFILETAEDFASKIARKELKKEQKTRLKQKQ